MEGGRRQMCGLSPLQRGRAPGGAEFREMVTRAVIQESFNGAAPRGARN